MSYPAAYPDWARALVATVAIALLILLICSLAGCASLEQDPEHDKASAMRICMRTTPGGIGWNTRFEDCIKSYGHKS